MAQERKINKNLPNILTVSRVVLVPVFMAILMIPIFNDLVTRIVCGLLFFAISMTDLVDGKLARKYDLISEFGKFMDPLADKLLIFGAMLALTVYGRGDLVFAVLMSFSIFIVLLREFAVTSLRMLFKGSGVIAANNLGKFKTGSQVTFVITALVEPLLWYLPFWPSVLKIPVLTYGTLAFMVVMTVVSGINYFVIYLPKKK